MGAVNIIMPTGALGSAPDEDLICTAMRVIGVGFGQPNDWNAKYGCDYENDVFAMHRHCWCERSDCPWCAGCNCANNDWADGPKAPEGVKCDWCAGVHRWADKGALPPSEWPHYGAPHFWFKPSGFRLWWYKYIGRGMEVHGALPNDFLDQVFATHPSGMTVDEAITETARQEEETAEGFRRMLLSLSGRLAEDAASDDAT